MDLLWPDAGRKAASNNLRQALYAARRTFSREPTGYSYLASDDGSLILCPEGDLWVDVEAFEQTAADRKSTRLNSSHANISYAVFCLKKKNTPFPLYQLYYCDS